MFSSPLARLALSSSRRSLFPNLFFYVRPGPKYTSYKCAFLPCFDPFSIIHFWSVFSHSIFMGRRFPRCLVCIVVSAVAFVGTLPSYLACRIASRFFPLLGIPLTIITVFFRSLSIASCTSSLMVFVREEPCVFLSSSTSTLLSSASCLPIDAVLLLSSLLIDFTMFFIPGRAILQWRQNQIISLRSSLIASNFASDSPEHAIHTRLLQLSHSTLLYFGPRNRVQSKHPTLALRSSLWLPRLPCLVMISS